MYELKFINHLKASSYLLVTFLLIYIGAFALYGHRVELLFGLLFYLIISLPAIYLHIEYFIRNYKMKLLINDNGITVYNGNKSKEYRFTDITKVVLFKSANLDKGGIQISPSESYYYLRLINKLGDDIILTCLLVPDIEKVLNLLDGVTIVRKKTSICFTFIIIN